jgi:hypothetical protein
MALNDSAELLDLIQLRGSIPANNPDWTDAKVLAQASREMIETHLPMLLAARGEYLVKTQDIALVSGQLGYRLHPRCASVRYVGYLQSDGTLREIPEANPGELFEMTANINTRGAPARFTFREHSLELWPLPSSGSDKLRVKWHIRPSRICVTSEAARINLIELNTPAAGQTRLTFSAPTSPGSIWSGSTRFDLVKSTSPFDVIGLDLLPLSSSATTRVFTATELPSELEVGDYIAPANYSPFANVLVELHEPIALRAAAAMVGAKGDGLADRLVGEATAKERQLLVGVLAPRSKGNAKTILTRRWRY